MALTPQLAPTDYAALETVTDRSERERLYAENSIYAHQEPQGVRYTKGTDVSAEKRSWQSLDVVLRSDAHAAAALPRRNLRLSRLFTALTIAAGVLTVAGVAASAREGLNLGELNGTGGVLLGGGLATLGLGVTAGVFYGKTKKGYQRAVDVYNESLGMRLGILDGKGEYIPPRGALVDEEGFILLEEPERAAGPAPESSAPAALPKPDPPAPGDPTSPKEIVSPETDGSTVPPTENTPPRPSASPEAAPSAAPSQPEATARLRLHPR